MPITSRELASQLALGDGAGPETNGMQPRSTRASPLHVLEVFQPETGGVPRYVANLARGLLRDGWPVTVAGPPRALESSELQELGVEILPIAVRRAPHPLQDLATVRQIARWCRERDVSVIHGHSTKASLLAALAGRRAGIPSVYTPHGWAFERLDRPALRASYALFEREMAHRYHAAVITVSSSGRAAAERWRVTPKGRIRVVPTGLSPTPVVSKATARRRLGLRPEEYVAVWVGRTGDQKRPQDLAPIARGLRGSTTVLALCDQLQGSALGDELEAAGVLVLDSEMDPEIAYGAADVLLHTSSWEACPLVVLEAMWASRPVVAYDVGGLSEQVQAGRTGYLVAQGDVGMMCECIRALARRPELREAMGEAAHQRVAKLFAYSSMLEGIRDTYTSVAGGRPVLEQGFDARRRKPVMDIADVAG
ncbi:MAG TPA: glycosyltransferase family 4 protein [Solirubrobacteraceae bacterium]